MSVFCIATRRSMPHLKEMLEQKSVFLDLVGFAWGCSSRRDHQALYFYPRQQPAGAGQRHKMGAFLASFLARFMVRQFRDVILEDLIRHHYFYFRQAERQEIAALARQNFQKGTSCRKLESVQAIIESRLIDFFTAEGAHLNLEGFINFRLQDYQQELKRAVDGAVESYLAEKEYRELIRMLRYFLEMEEPKIELIHLSVDKKGQFHVTDQHSQQIDPRDWEELTMEELEDGDYEDLLVSMLVTVAPRRIMVHQNVLPRYPGTVETLRRIFDQRLSFCGGCSYCQAASSRLSRDQGPP